MRVLLSGYYGFGNLGDDALLEIIVHQLKTRYPYAEIDVLSAEPERTAHAFGVDATARMDFGAIGRAIGRAHVVLSGGGGLLQNATSLKSLVYYANILRTAVAEKKAAMIFAQSIGPLDFLGKQTVRQCARGISAATVRDERSRELLQPLVPHLTVRRTADPVFLFEHGDDARSPDLDDAGLGLGSEPLVLVAVRKTARFAEGAQTIALAVDRLSERHGARVAFVPFGGAADAEAATLVIRKCQSQPALVPLDGLATIARAIERAQLVIGVRLHALILAARFGVPFLAVPYDPKVAALTEDLGYPLPPLWDPGVRALPTAETTIALVDEVWSRRASLATGLRDASVAMRALAMVNFETLDSLMHARVSG